MRFRNGPSSFQDAEAGLSDTRRHVLIFRGRAMLLPILKRVLFVAGAGMLGYAIFTIVESNAMQRYKAVEFDRTLALPANRRAKPEKVVAGQAIGKLTIPSVGISAIVLEGADYGTLKIAPGHIPGTALPGQGGNVAIAGHRDTFFRNLEKIRNGDTLSLSTLKGNYQYRVDLIKVVDPTRTDVLDSSGIRY